MEYIIVILFVAIFIAPSYLFQITSINGTSPGEMVVVISFKDNFLQVQGEGINNDYSISLQDGDCYDGMPLDKYHAFVGFTNITDDGRSAVIELPFNYTTYLGIYNLCIAQNNQLFSRKPVGIFIGIRTLYQFCHKFGATAKAIRNCIKSNGNQLTDVQPIKSIPNNFKDPIFRNLDDYVSSDIYLLNKKLQEEIYSNYSFPKESINKYDYGMSKIPGGYFMMGSDVINARTDPISGMSSPGEGEYPLRPAHVKSFYMDKTEVTNGQFREFVRKTKYKTDAEIYGWSFVFETLLDVDVARESEFMVKGNPWWHKINGAYWRLPYGPKSKINYELDHPVVHISYRDAQNYCHWRGKRLPTEAEWEYASRGGLHQNIFPWGNEPPNQFAWKGKRDVPLPERCNLFQGEFPYNNTVDDGWYGTSPAMSFKPNNFNLYNMVGNVWNWVEDEYNINHNTDLYEVVTPFYIDELNYNISKYNIKKRVSKGGSFICFFLCARNSARQGIDSDSSASNLGFRCAKDLNISNNNNNIETENDFDYEIHYGQYISKDAIKSGTKVIINDDTEHVHEMKYPAPPDIYHP